MTELTVDEQKKVLRALARLKHSILADREIEQALTQLDELGAQGYAPRLEISLSDLVGEE